MAKHPGERYRDGAVMAAALRAAQASMHDPGASTAALPAPRPAGAGASANPTVAVGSGGGSAGGAPAPGSGTIALPPNGAAATVVRPRKAPPSTLRRRRRRGPWMVLAVVLVALAAGAALLLRGTARTTVPLLQGLHRASVLARTGASHIHPLFASHYSHAPAGVAIAEIPRAGTRVRQGSSVHVLMSAGPPPVAVPSAVGEPAAEAEAAVAAAGLRYDVHATSAPGHTAGTVLAQSPAAAASAPSGSTVTLTIAAVPQWRTVTSFAGVDDGQSVPFDIRGRRWRLAYTMSYRHTCLLLVVCEGPSAAVEDLSTGSDLGEFELDEGAGTHYRVFEGGPGLYRVVLSGGHDSARWAATVEDFD